MLYVWEGYILTATRVETSEFTDTYDGYDGRWAPRGDAVGVGGFGGGGGAQIQMQVQVSHASFC